MRVRDLMIQDVATARPEDSLDQAVRSMRDRDCGCVPVVAQDGEVLGVLTDRDVCMCVLRTDKPLSELTVDAAMSSLVFLCRADESIAEAEGTMGRHQVRRLPVVDEDGRLCGILSLDDLAQEARREKDLFATPVSAEGVGYTLGQIARPHLIDTEHQDDARS